MNGSYTYSTGQRLLTIDNVCVHYDRPILEGVSGHIDNIQREGMQQGQVVCLLGPSGIGKSQLFRCIAGLQRPTSGSIRLNGHQREVQPGEVGVVAQNYPLFNHRSVWGNLMLAATRHGRDDYTAAEACLALLEKFGLVDQAKCHPMMLSGGQRQRVAIAQQLVSQKTLLLMDEPFSGLDPAALDEVVKLLVQVRDMDELNTLFIVTHDIRTALKVADTVLMLGRDRTPEGKPSSGAHIKEKIDLVELGLAYRDDLDADPKFLDLERRIKAEFSTL